MSAPSSFTGRVRQRRTTRMVRVGDKLARLFIVVGGIGTIIAVAGVCVFLLYVAGPLFLGATADEPRAVQPTWRAADAPLKLTMDEDQTMAWAMLPDGGLKVFQLAGDRLGSLLDTRAAADLYGQAKLTAASFAISGDQITLGFDDGSLRRGMISFATSYLNPDQLDEATRQLPIGGSAVLKNGLVERTPIGQYRFRTLQVTLDEPIKGANAAAIVRLSQAERPTGAIYCALSNDGKILVSSERRRNNLQTGKSTVRLVSQELPPVPTPRAEPPQHLFVSGVGDDVLVIWRDGLLVRYDISTLSSPKIAETVDLVPEEGGTVNAAAFTVGKTTLVVGDSQGRVRGWFKVPRPGAGTPNDLVLVAAHEMPSAGTAVTALATSGQNRTCVASFADGSMRLYFLTTDKMLLEIPAPQVAGNAPPQFHTLSIAPRDNGILAATDQGFLHQTISLPHPDFSVSALFRPLWYEGYGEPASVWQSSSGSDAAETKFGMWPLVFGTLKATFYSMLIGVPLALLAAVYTSEFLHPRTRAKIKPTIELMAGLPSVVLGFMAALVFAPLFEQYLPEFLSALFTVPFAVLLCAFLWQLLPHNARLRLMPWRLLFILPSPLLGIYLATYMGRSLEHWLFAGDLRAWLDGRVGNAFGGWMLLLFPVSAAVTAVTVGTRIDPWLRRFTWNWSRAGCAIMDLVKFLIATLLAVVAAAAAAWLMQTVLVAIGSEHDLRGSLLGGYETRNSLVVGCVMGFAIIPIIYTIAEDALSSVPAPLRSASLGAGATQWQTATRIIIPTAMSGLFSAIMIGLGRAIGETMIVLMATGSTPILDFNPFTGFRTLSANIAIELPEAVRGSTHFRLLFLSALVLFSMTFVLNTLAEIVRKRVRRRAYQL